MIDTAKVFFNFKLIELTWLLITCLDQFWTADRAQKCYAGTYIVGRDRRKRILKKKQWNL